MLHCQHHDAPDSAHMQSHPETSAGQELRYRELFQQAPVSL